MAISLLDLPLETLQVIVEYTIPANLDSLSLTCRGLNRAVQRYIPEHREMKRRFRNFSLRSREDVFATTAGTYGPIIDVALGLFLELVQNPDIGWYVEKTDFTNETGTFGFDQHYSSGHIDKRTQNISRDKLQDYIYGISCIDPFQMDPSKWVDSLLIDISNPEDGTSCCLCMLLAGLPNLKELSLPSDWTLDSHDVHANIDHKMQFLDLLVNMANESQTEDVPLGKLRRIMPSDGCGYESRHALQSIAPLLALTSLEEVSIGSAVAVDDGYTGIPFEPRGRVLGPNLKILELHGCAIVDEEMAKLLKDMNNLQSLAFSFEGKWHGCCHDMFFGRLVQAIADSPAVRSLTDLTLDIVALHGCNLSPVRDFKAFKRLENLVLHIGYMWREAQPTPTAEHPLEWLLREEDPSDLEAFLPTSIKSFTLLADAQDKSVKALEYLFSGVDVDVFHGRCLGLEQFRLVLGSAGATSGIAEAPEIDRKTEPWPKIMAMLQVLPGGELVEVQGPAISESLRAFNDRFKYPDRY